MTNARDWSELAVAVLLLTFFNIVFQSRVVQYTIMFYVADFDSTRTVHVSVMVVLFRAGISKGRYPPRWKLCKQQHFSHVSTTSLRARTCDQAFRWDFFGLFVRCERMHLFRCELVVFQIEAKAIKAMELPTKHSRCFFHFFERKTDNSMPVRYPRFRNLRGFMCVSNAFIARL